MKKNIFLLALSLTCFGFVVKAQDAVVFKSVTVNGLKKEDTKRLVRGRLPVCGYYSKSDSLFYSCSLDNPVKILDPNSLKDGTGCCESITFGRIDAYKQYFSISGAVDNVDSTKGEIRLKKGEISYFIQLQDPASIRTLAPAMTNHPDRVTIHLKN